MEELWKLLRKWRNYKIHSMDTAEEYRDEFMLDMLKILKPRFACECDKPDYNVTHHSKTDGFLTIDKYMLTTCCKKRIEYR